MTNKLLSWVSVLWVNSAWYCLKSEKVRITRVLTHVAQILTGGIKAQKGEETCPSSNQVKETVGKSPLSKAGLTSHMSTRNHCHFHKD